ncbi:MAG TPA: protein kinase [Terriglobales bacterium]|jgi:Tol biopolymer transport system component|nr:protein kinase [Terriglobales bacterium]
MIENWERIQSLFLQALELPAEQRTSFLNKACADNPEVRTEVESLLAHDVSGGHDIGAAVVGAAKSVLESVALQPGARIEHYEIEKLIGSGGMGEVYRARDLHLARDVAIKVLPSFVTSDTDRLQRFQQEARAAAALNHPNILGVYQLGIHEGAPYLVSELLDGVTLREHMKQGPLTPRVAVGYGVQIAFGLAAAHEKGIVHRDLKPENLFLTRSGRVKILDFGLAKLTGSAPTFVGNAAFTEHGLVMGTVRYMSPEQVRGETVDPRCDIFAFGVVLYEMLTATCPFQRASSAETMAAILNETPPDVGELSPAVPPSLQRIVRRCLEKDRDRRFQSASDLAFALEALSDSGIVGASGGRVTGIRARLAKAVPRRRSAFFAIAACAALLALAYRFRPAMPAPEIRRIVQLTKSGGARPDEPLYTDGPRIYYESIGPLAADWQLRQVVLNGDDDARVPVPAALVRIRGFSPDNTEFVAISHLEGQSGVWTLPIGGGSPRRVGNLVADDIAWSHDGSWFAYARGNQLFLTNADGTSSRLLTTLPAEAAGAEHVHWSSTVPEISPQIDHIRWSPDDRTLRFTRITAGPGGSVVFPTRRALWEVGADGGNLHELRFNWPGTPMECCGDWTPDGRYFVFASRRGGTSNLWMLEEKSDWWRRRNPDPVQLTFGPMNYNRPAPSRNGQNIFAIGVQDAGELVRYDSKRKDFQPFLDGRSLALLSFSRDGKWLAYVAYPEGTLWRSRSDGTEQLQLTFAPLQVGGPRWSADGRWIVFHARQPGQSFRNYIISADGGNPEPFPADSLPQCSPDWMPGRDAVIYSRVYAGEDPGLYVFDRQRGRSEKIPGSDALYGPSWSPDGRYLLSVDAADDRLFLFDPKSGKRTQIAGPAAWPTWSPDSKYIYFVRWGINSLLRVRVPDGQEEKALELPFRLADWPFMVAPDGSLILLREHGRYDVYSLSLTFR